MNAPHIHIKTRLHDGIYKANGGGETVTHYTWRAGPRNLLKAVDTAAEHRKHMQDCYGNIGCGRTWIEINDHEIDGMDESDLRFSDKEIGVTVNPKSRTQKAAKLISETP